ncbi:dihydrodipicolinate synthase family protein [Paenibacillus qinlingensis]|uniref:dihydrodipicolinate synthase family protein n=1 Tax=Paenibacillus qinlingensis TaxID=1837343 RepID=UPI0015640B85|nr:dihydrodipicolinate synthase family protein [Paenibacillus qinlingensis]NQX64231.1 dihydrodipicolinate synthase family protein [Paenibacillus qinlingensis]
MSLRGNIPVIPTPFVDGNVFFKDFDRLIEHTANSLDGYVVCGSTGEAPALSKDERIQIVDYIVKKVPSGKEIVVGLGHTNIAEAVEIGKAAAHAGVKAALVPSPYYFPNSLDMVEEYVGKLANLTGLDIVFYDNPTTTGTRFTADELLHLAQTIPSVKAIKMTDHAFAKIRKLKEQSNLIVFGGDDIICFRAFEAGVDGNMIIAPIIYPKEFRDCWDLYCSGNRSESFKLYTEVILPFISMFGPGDEIPTSKALLYHLGIFSSPETRLPLINANERRIQEVMLGYEAGLKQLK